MNKIIIFTSSIFLIIQSGLFASANANEQNLALMFIDKWMQEGTETCEEFGEGEFYLRFNPLQIIDITNDGVEDYILHETSGLCDTSASMFAGGTGGEHWRIYINPKINNFNFDEYVDLWVRDWALTTYENKTALYISEHGQVCDRAGYIGCNSIVSISSEGVGLLEGPIPSDLITSFSPNRNQITFSFNVNNSSQIFISNSDSSNTKQISQENGEYFNPTWSPLGDLIAFSKIEGGKSYIGVMDIDGKNERMITTDRKVDNPQWFEDGKKIIFYKTSEGVNTKVHIIDVTGFNERPYAMGYSNNVGATTCYAEINSAVYVDGLCDIEFDVDNPYTFVLSHQVPCDDTNKSYCGYSYTIYNTENYATWSVNTSGDDKRASHMQNFIGEEFTINIEEEYSSKKFCAKDKNSSFCFMIPPNLNNDTFLNQISELE